MRRRRFGAVRQLASRRWQARYTVADGVMVTADTTFATKAEADRFLSRTELDLHGGTWLDPRQEGVTVQDWAARWMAATQHIKPKTRSSYASLLRSVIVPTLGRKALRDLRPMQVREWVAALSAKGYSASRVRQSYRLLSQLLDAAVADGLLAANPCSNVRLPRLPEHEPNVLTPDEVRRLAGRMPAQYRLFTLLLAYTGMRFGEAAGLARRRVDLDRSRLVVAASLSDADGILTIEEPKTHQHRLVTLPAFLVDELRDHLRTQRFSDPEALVFVSPEGFPVRHGNFLRRVWRPACARAGVTATPHDLRATHATWLYDMGWSPVEIATRLGHSKATVTTQFYARAVVGRDVEIAARLDELAAGATSGEEAAR